MGRRCLRLESLRGSLAAKASALLAALTLAAPAAASVTLTDPGQGHVNLPAGGAGAGELSGLAYAGADQYYAVSDAGGTLFELDIDVDAATGEIVSAAVVGFLALAAGSDLEGVVHYPLGGSVYASDEVGPAIREYRLSDGAVLANLALPAIYGQIRSNFGLESLAMRLAPNPTDAALWTANEEALAVDGPLSTNANGSFVRLQRFDDTLTPDGQWAYLSDPYPGNPFGGSERSGVADLLAVPTGELLVLERSFSSALFRARIYQVDFAGATDTSALASLDSEPFTPVGKTLLWQLASGFRNYEGITLGPPLDGSEHSVLLVSDDGGGASQSLYALRLPEPGRSAALSAGLLLLTLLRLFAGSSKSVR